MVNMNMIIAKNEETITAKIKELQELLDGYCQTRQEIGVLITAFTPQHLVDSELDDEYKKIDEKVKSTKSKIEFLQSQLNALQEYSKTLGNPELLETAEKELERIYPTGKNGKLLW